MIGGNFFFDEPIKNDNITYEKEKRLPVKQMITELVVYYIMLTLKISIK